MDGGGEPYQIFIDVHFVEMINRSLNSYLLKAHIGIWYGTYMPWSWYYTAT